MDVSGDVTRLVRELRTERRYAEIDINGRSLRSILDRQPIFTFEGNGSWEDRRVVPQTAAAAKLLTGPRGAEWERVVRGVLGVSQAREGVDRLGGIAFSTGRDGFAVGQAVAVMSHWMPEPEEGPRRVGEYFPTGPDLRDYLQRTARRPAAASNGGMIAVGPTVTRAVSRAINQRDADFRDGTPGSYRDWGSLAAKVLGHEVEHSVTAPTPATYNSRLGWIEEASAQVMTEWPGWHRRSGEKLGLPTHGRHPERFRTYREHTDAMRRILRLGGVDTRRIDNFDRADALLQGGSLQRTPGRLASAIVEHHGLDRDTAYEPIRTAIRDAAWSAEGALDPSLLSSNVRDLERMVGELAGSSPA